MCVYVHTHTVNACPILQGSVSCVPNWLGPMGDQSLNLGTGVAGHVGADMVVLLLFVWVGERVQFMIEQTNGEIKQGRQKRNKCAKTYEPLATETWDSGSALSIEAATRTRWKHLRR